MTWLLITAGQGPSECQRFAFLLMAEIHREAEERGLKCDLLQANPGSEKQTLLSALLAIEGSDLTQFIEAWQGTHRWICPSPFRPNHGRKNWYVGVQFFQQPQQLQWNDHDLRVDTFRSSGPGGQHANKTSSAVRITHIPSGITVVAQEERSQQRNRALAMARLSDALAAEQRDRQKAAVAEQWMQHISLERGNEVRVYVSEKMNRKK